MPNQHKPLPPLDIIAPDILRLWKARQTDKQILEYLRKHIDTTRYGIGLTRLVETRVAMGLLRTRQQNHSIETIHDAMVDLRAMYPKAGAREMLNLNPVPVM
ncbi:hypothetical protein M405DRAFT_883041 [Rhizopogon salebrosus TDB-379]|nr:hypothetical protein M405DRAFT_883041 [Rhizopogon salebrosus TDB-379]